MIALLTGTEKRIVIKYYNIDVNGQNCSFQHTYGLASLVERQSLRPVFPNFFFILIFCAQTAAAQPCYTRVRGAFGAELFGITPKGAAIAEAAFGYFKRSFWNVQAGLGAVNKNTFRSPTLSGALTHCFVLNPYKRKSCVLHPGHYLIESYFEAGLGGFAVDRYDNDLYAGTSKQRLFTPSALAGFRLHVVTGKWIYILKLRYTPPLLANLFASYAGLGLGLAWR
ncbi:hypothetical protein FEM33_12000 [Dyadobacter flavalbus]|uniref:Conjugal transfer protein TraO n=1 Tax=Dyadobacter flavalbus TaxID=2579942 RepID=A0A5M8QWI1_9BACT|nr:hypothetical protein [Dyadobacter flavalbus]KAA6439006.1 hypothetical protein FEM33_12000 [Dyadobacter flavalbus]